MRTLITVLCLLIPVSASAVVISGVPGHLTNGGAGAGALQIFDYYDSHGYEGLFDGLSTDIPLFNSMLEFIDDTHVEALSIPGAIEGFAEAKGFQFNAEMISFYFFSFDDYKTEIDAGRPVEITTDDSPDWFRPMSVAGVGYDIINDIPHFGFVSSMTGLNNIIWKPWIESTIDYAWGVNSVITMTPQSAAPVPEPATVLLLAVGLIAIGLRKILNR